MTCEKEREEDTALNETTKRLLAVATPYVLVYLEPPVGRTWSAAPVPRTRDETILLTINNKKKRTLPLHTSLHVRASAGGLRRLRSTGRSRTPAQDRASSISYKNYTTP